jgi:effector-binding domain-containing protein
MTIEIRTADPRPVVYREASVARAELGGRLGELLPAVYAEILAAGGQPDGAPFVRFQRDGEPLQVQAGLPVTAPVAATPPSVAGELPGGRHAVAVHTGPYDTLPESWRRLREWLAAHGERPAAPGWESYLTDPGSEPDPSRWVTEITVPLA